MKHYYHPMSRAVTTDWMLKELDAPHEQIVVDFPKGENLAPEFLAINPMAKIPALVDGDAVVTEVAAICTYLADKFIDRGMAPAFDSAERGTYYRYLFFPGTTLEPMMTVHQAGVTGISPQSAGWGDIDRCLTAVEALTPAEGWALGDHFTTADVVFGGTVDFATQFGWLTDPSERVKAYVERIRERPIYRETHPESWYS